MRKAEQIRAKLTVLYRLEALNRRKAEVSWSWRLRSTPGNLAALPGGRGAASKGEGVDSTTSQTHTATLHCSAHGSASSVLRFSTLYPTNSHCAHLLRSSACLYSSALLRSISDSRRGLLSKRRAAVLDRETSPLRHDSHRSATPRPGPQHEAGRHRSAAADRSQPQIEPELRRGWRRTPPRSTFPRLWSRDSASWRSGTRRRTWRPAGSWAVDWRRIGWW